MLYAIWWSLFYFILGIAIGIPLLMLVAKIFKLSNSLRPSLKFMIIISFLASLGALVLGSGLGWIFIILYLVIVVLSVYLIKKFFDVSLWKAIGMSLLLYAFVRAALFILLLLQLFVITVLHLNVGF